MGQKPAAVQMVPPRPVMLPAALLDEDRAWCREQLAIVGVPIFDDYRNPHGAGPDTRWITTDLLR